VDPMAGLRLRGAAHWTAVVLALVPVPFVINDTIRFRLWQAEWWWLPFAVIYTLFICALIYAAVRGVFWLIARVRR
jgi:hypothetical protein